MKKSFILLAAIALSVGVMSGCIDPKDTGYEEQTIRKTFPDAMNINRNYPGRVYFDLPTPNGVKKMQYHYYDRSVTITCIEGCGVSE